MSDTEVIVLGKNGQLGSEWLETLQKKGIRVKGYSSSELNITDSNRIEEILDTEKPKLVINASAYTKVDKAEEEWKIAFEVNGKAVGELAKACQKRSIKLVHYSTDYVFSGSESDIQEFPAGYSENHPLAPQNQYAISKLMGELYIREQMTDYLIIRVAWLCGKNGNNFIKTMLRLGKERPELNVVNDQFGAPSFVDNVIENTIALLNIQAKGTFHIASKGLTNWYEFAKTALELKEMQTVVNPISSNAWPSPVKRPSFSKLSTAKIEMLDGVKLEHWTEGLKRLISTLD
ncbi:dTDP-4-dehydrorhamnose reductase [bacterium]|nr:MAG: dTDP-4-dehydrorhamnose reductase [bacterium]